MSEAPDLSELRAVLDCDTLHPLAIKLLVADVRLGDVSDTDYRHVIATSTGRIKQNAMTVLGAVYYPKTYIRRPMMKQ
jgi:hypothetical protein